MFKKHLFWLAFVVFGGLCLVYISQNAARSETRFFQDLFLKNNREVGYLVARQIYDELRQVKSRMEGFSGFLLKQGFNQKKVAQYFRYNFERDAFLSGVQIHHRSRDHWGRYHSLRSPVTSGGFYLQSVEKHFEPFYEQNRDFFSVPFASDGGSKLQISWIQMVRDTRKGEILGILEGRIDLSKLYEFASKLTRSRRGGVLLVDKSGKIILPKKGGWKLTPSDLKRLGSGLMGEFLRDTQDGQELVSFCSLKVLDGFHMPPWTLVVVEDDLELRKVTERLEWNLWLISGVGVLCLMLLGKLVFYR
jgi:hypothetical protein